MVQSSSVGRINVTINHYKSNRLLISKNLNVFVAVHMKMKLTIEMAMIVQLILSVRVFVVDDGVVSVVIVVLLLGGEGSSTIADDDMTTNGGGRKTLSSSYPHCRRHHNSQPRTISTRKGYACVTDYHP